MNRSLHVRNEAGAWLATPASGTTVDELQRALEAFPDLKLIVEGGVIVLVRADPITEPPDLEALGLAMFGEDHDAILVEETGEHEQIDEEAIPPVG